MPDPECRMAVLAYRLVRALFRQSASVREAAGYHGVAQLERGRGGEFRWTHPVRPAPARQALVRAQQAVAAVTAAIARLPRTTPPVCAAGVTGICGISS